MEIWNPSPEELKQLNLDIKEERNREHNREPEDHEVREE